MPLAQYPLLSAVDARRFSAFTGDAHEVFFKLYIVTSLFLIKPHANIHKGEKQAMVYFGSLLVN
jgi:hypothetical protein